MSQFFSHSHLYIIKEGRWTERKKSLGVLKINLTPKQIYPYSLLSWVEVSESALPLNKCKLKFDTESLESDMIPDSLILRGA